MSRPAGATLVVALGLFAALSGFTTTAPEASAARMCPPVTIETLFPEPVAPPPPAAPTTTTPTPDDDPVTTTVPGDTSTTAPPETTTTTAGPATTTTQPETTTTMPEATTTVTTIPSESTTTSADGSTTTTQAPGSTTTATPAPRPSGCAPFTYRMGWPLAGEGQVISGFGSDRDGGARHHQGNDIVAQKLTPVVAVADGVVMKVVQEVGTEDCCWLSIRHQDGWQSYYIHLNNDRYGTDDGMGIGVRPDLVDGTEVAAGEVIGWVGDSGNAEETVVHLHFELRRPGGEAVDPRPSLQSARNRAELSDPEPNWPYADDDGLDSEWLAASLLTEGLFLPCDATQIRFCPREAASPQMAESIARHLTNRAPPPLEGRYRTLAASDQGSDVVERGSGCAQSEECFVFGVPESDIARLAAWARIEAMVASLLPKTSPIESPSTIVNLPSVSEAESRLRAEGLLGDCHRGLDDHQLASRQTTVGFLSSWLQGIDPEPCPDPDQRAR